MLHECINSRRHTEHYLGYLTQQLGPPVLMFIEEILTMEVKELMNDKRIFSPPSQLSPEMARNFAFDKITTAYGERAPFTWKLVQTLSGVDIPDQESDEGNSEKGTSEDESEHNHSNTTATRVRSTAGVLDDTGMLDDNTVLLNHTEGRLQKKEKLKTTKLLGQVNVRNKVLMASSAMAVMLNSRNERLNHFQNMVSIGYSIEIIYMDTKFIILNIGYNMWSSIWNP